MAEPIIKLENVNFWYEKGKSSEMQALKNISITVERGEYVAFFGPSGSGKTTLLYLISGVEPSQDGKILINGRDISNFSNRELAIYRQVGVGIVFQQFNLISNLTVLNNVALPMAFLGISEKKRREEAMKILKRLMIDDLADRLPGELSGGQQQRVGIGRALANNAPIIIADEPLGNLDSENSKKVLEFFREIHEKDNRTIIMVTHEAWSLKDVEKVFYIKDGQLVKEEKTTPKALAESLTHQLTKELVPEETKTQVVASALASLLLPNFMVEEVARFQSYVDQRLTGKIESLEFLQVLDKSFKDGGVGLRTPTARKIGNYVEGVLQKRKEVDEIYQELKKDPLAVLTTQPILMAQIIELRKWLLLEYHGNLGVNQIIRLDEALLNHLRKIITYEDFRKVLNLPRSKSGIGFSIHTAERIGEKLQLVLKSQDDVAQ